MPGQGAWSPTGTAMAPELTGQGCATGTLAPSAQPGAGLSQISGPLSGGEEGRCLQTVLRGREARPSSELRAQLMFSDAA